MLGNNYGCTEYIWNCLRRFQRALGTSEKEGEECIAGVEAIDVSQAGECSGTGVSERLASSGEVVTACVDKPHSILPCERDPDAYAACISALVPRTEASHPGGIYPDVNVSDPCTSAFESCAFLVDDTIGSEAGATPRLDIGGSSGETDGLGGVGASGS